MFFTDASFQLGEKDCIIKELHLLYYAKPSRQSLESIYITHKEEMCFLFSKLDFGSGLQISKRPSQHSWLVIYIPSGYLLCDLAELMICPALDFMY